MAFGETPRFKRWSDSAGLSCVWKFQPLYNSVIALKLGRDEQEIIARPDRIWARVKSTRPVARPPEIDPQTKGK